MLFYMYNIMGTDHHLVCYLSHYISYSTEKDISTCHERKLEANKGIIMWPLLPKMVLKKKYG